MSGTSTSGVALRGQSEGVCGFGLLGHRGALTAIPTAKQCTPIPDRAALTARGNVPLHPKLLQSPAQVDYFHRNFMKDNWTAAVSNDYRHPRERNSNCNHKLDIHSGRYFCTKVLSVKERISPFSADFWIGTPAPYFTQARGAMKQTKKRVKEKPCTLYNVPLNIPGMEGCVLTFS